MLALSRKKDEAIIINDNIEVKILEIKGDQIKIGVSAPKSVPIYRKEVFTQIQEANKEASESVDMEKLKKFFAGVKKEMSRVRWPQKKEMIKYSVAVLACIIVFAIFFVASDLIIAGARTLAEGLK